MAFYGPGTAKPYLPPTSPPRAVRDSDFKLELKPPTDEEVLEMIREWLVRQEVGPYTITF